MIRRVRWLIAAWIGAIAFAAAQTPSPSPTNQTFRASTDLVFVDVSVRRAGQPVTGLTAADFDLRDNGVRQKIESVEAAAVPIDLTLVIDVGIHGGTATAPPNPAETTTAFVNDAIRSVTSALRPTDRLRVLAADSYVRQIVALQPAQPAPRLDRVQWGGHTAIYDALAAALLQPVDPSRRHVVVAAVKDKDCLSSATSTTVAELAERSDALFHAMTQESQVEKDADIRELQCVKTGLCGLTARFWYTRVELLRDCDTALDPACLKQLTEQGRLLKSAAESTGGTWHQSLAMTEPTIGDVFRKAFDDFRSSYLLRYSAQGVKREGWHAITVAVTGQRGATVRWRRGYSVDTASPDVAAAAVTAPASSPAPNSARTFPLPRTFADFTAAFDRGDTSAITLGLRALYGDQYLGTKYRDADRLFQDLQSASTPWPGDLGREAAFALTLTEAAAALPMRIRDREAAAVLDRYSRLVRHPIDPDELELAYLWAQASLAQGLFTRVSSQTAANTALARFPDDPRFVLAAAIATDQQWRTSAALDSVGRTPAVQTLEAHVADVTSRYTRAAEFPRTRAEALIRLSWLQHRTGHPADALATVDRAPIEARDLDMDYLHHLFRGHYLIALGRLDEAIAAYRTAAGVLPGAQSARIALMNALVVKGDMAAANAAGTTAETMSTTTDPWWTFWFGDYRWYPQALKALREARR